MEYSSRDVKNPFICLLLIICLLLYYLYYYSCRVLAMLRLQHLSKDYKCSLVIPSVSISHNFKPFSPAACLRALFSRVYIKWYTLLGLDLYYTSERQHKCLGRVINHFTIHPTINVITK